MRTNDLNPISLEAESLIQQFALRREEFKLTLNIYDYASILSLPPLCQAAGTPPLVLTHSAIAIARSKPFQLSTLFRGGATEPELPNALRPVVG